MLGMKAFAGKPPLHIDKTDKHRIDRACPGFRFQIFERNMSRHGHFEPPVDSRISQTDRLAGQKRDASHFRPEYDDIVGYTDPNIDSRDLFIFCKLRPTCLKSTLIDCTVL